jgi:hypothetical protein
MDRKENYKKIRKTEVKHYFLIGHYNYSFQLWDNEKVQHP